MNLNVHFHTLAIDGVYEENDEGKIAFRPLPPPDDRELARVAGWFARSLTRLLARRGFGSDEDPPDHDQPHMASLYGASVRGRIATGKRAGRRVTRMGDRIDAEQIEFRPGERCAVIGGISLHANVCVPSRDRNRLERLCRYVARPPVATGRLSQMPDGRLVYRLRRRWRDGTTHVVFEPLEFLEKLAALVPRPRSHLVRYHGVLAPRSRYRELVVPGGSEHGTGHVKCARGRSSSRDDAANRGVPIWSANTDMGGSPASPDADDHKIHPRKYSWPELMKRVFEIDVLECPECKARPMRILAAIHPPETTVAILECLGLPARPPPVAPARLEEEEQVEFDFGC